MASSIASVIHPHPGPPPQLPELPEGVVRGPSWRPWTAPLALLAAVTVALFGQVAIDIIAAIGGAQLDNPPAEVQIAGTVFQDLALVGTVLFFARRRGSANPGHFGLRPVGIGSALGWGVLTLAASLVFTGAWGALMQAPQREHLLHDLGADRGGAAMIAVAALVCVLAPIAEEIFFRGYFFTALRGWRGTGPAAVLTGVTFGLVHAGSAPVVYLVPLAFLGFALCLLYRRTGSLYPCIGLHSVNNALAFGVSENWDWQIPVLLVCSLALIALILRVLVTFWPPNLGRLGASHA